MEKVLLGKTNIKVSRTGFGVLPMGPSQLNLSPEKGSEIIRYALEKGINFFDTAQYYKTYPHLAKALNNGNYNPVISSKCLGESYEEMSAAIEEARIALNRDVIDIFLMHEVRTGQLEARRGAWESLMDARAKGLVKAIGISTHHVDVTKRAASIKECDVIFPLINYAGLGIRRGNEAGTAGEMLEAIKKCSEAGKGVFTMKALGGGNLTASYHKALDYVFSRHCIDSVMLGFGKKDEVDDLLAYLDGTMPQEYVPDVSLKRMHINQEDCEGCGHCLKACASGAISYGLNGLATIDASKCLTCGYCAPVCPVRAIIMY